jgi:class 3 adenylate cyclase
MSMQPDFGISPLDGATADMVRVETAFLCADVVRFTAMTERLGDPRSFRVMRRVARLVRAEAHRRGGKVVEIRGDSFLLAFPRTRAAVECALAIRQVLASDASGHPDGGVEVRMAIHAGEVIQIGDQYFGRNLILPYRMLSMTRSGEISMTEDALRITSAPLQLPASLRHFHPKGFSAPVSFWVLDGVALENAAVAHECTLEEARPSPACVCAWCGGGVEEDQTELTSHTMCETCAARLATEGVAGEPG